MNRFSLLLAAVSLSCGLGLIGNKPVRAEEKDPFARWEKAIAQMEQSDRKSKPAQGGILFVGSSSIRMWDLHKSFPYDKPLNRGFGGSQIVDSTHFAERIIFPHKPKKVFLYAGDNDIAKGKKAKDVYRDFMQFVKKVHTELPDAEIIFIAIKPSIKRWNLVDEIRTANKAIAAICEKDDKLTYVDIFKPMLGQDGQPRPELFAKDGLHLNDEGYRVWAQVIRPLLK